jgi:hypothetical protein
MVASFPAYVIQSAFLYLILHVWTAWSVRQLLPFYCSSVFALENNQYSMTSFSACSTLVTCDGLGQSSDSFPLPCTFWSSSLSSIHLFIYSFLHSSTYSIYNFFMRLSEQRKVKQVGLVPFPMYKNTQIHEENFWGAMHIKPHVGNLLAKGLTDLILSLCHWFKVTSGRWSFWWILSSDLRKDSHRERS